MDDVEAELDAIYHDGRPATVEDLRRLDQDLQAVIVRLNDIEDALRETRHNAITARKNTEFIGVLAVAVLVAVLVRWAFF